MNHNRARRALTVKELDGLEPGTFVVDADMDIYTKGSNGLWEGECFLTSTQLRDNFGPIKRWYE